MGKTNRSTPLQKQNRITENICCTPISDRITNHNRGFEIRGKTTGMYVRDVLAHEQEGTAKRIELTWNACEGVDDRLLKEGSVKLLVQACVGILEAIGKEQDIGYLADHTEGFDKAVRRVERALLKMGIEVK
jgi:hypothetical protein